MPSLRQALIAALQRGDERSARHRRAQIVDVERLRRAERALDERGQLGRRLAENRQRLDGEPLLPQRVDAFLGPRDILKHSDGKSPGFDSRLPF